MINPFKRSFLPFLLSAVAVGIWTWHSVNSDTVTAPLQEISSIPVQTESVTPSTFQPTETFSGFVRSTRQADIVPKISGYVVKLLKEPGESVRSGDILALLDGREFSAQNQSARLALDAAITLLAQTEQYTEQQVAAAEIYLSKVKDDRDQGKATDKDVRVAEAAVRTAKKQQNVQNAQAKTSVATLSGIEIETGTSLENRVIRAPFSGIIATKQTNIGALANPGSTLYTLISTDALEIPVSIPLRLTEIVRKGTPVSVLPEHSDQKREGEVFSIAPVGNAATGETVAIVRFLESKEVPSSAVLPGQYASVEFPAQIERESLLVPKSAVIRQYHETFVYVIADSRAHKQVVTIGSQSDNSYEILSGLRPGNTLVIEGMHSLQEAAPVRTTPHE